MPARHRCRSMRPSPPPRSSTSWATPTRPWWCSRAPTSSPAGRACSPAAGATSRRSSPSTTRPPPRVRRSCPGRNWRARARRTARPTPSRPKTAGRASTPNNRSRYPTRHAPPANPRTQVPPTTLYTSSTTGNPKGGVLSHANVLYEAASSTTTAGTDEPGITISYLPFAHIAERILGMYVPQFMSGHVHLISDPSLLVGALAEVRPTRFFGVPRVWEKIRTGVSARLAAEPDEAKRAGIEQAMAVGLEYVEALQFGNTPSPELTAKFEAMDGAVLGLLRALLGLDRVEWAASAAAPMPEDVARFFAGLGMRIYDVYGMTETSSAITACGPDAFRLGTVGRPLAGIEVKLAEDGEILSRGPVTMTGYHRQEDATRELIDSDGWVHTGDIGELDEDGLLTVVDRKKEIDRKSTSLNSSH